MSALPPDGPAERVETLPVIDVSRPRRPPPPLPPARARPLPLLAVIFGSANLILPLVLLNTNSDALFGLVGGFIVAELLVTSLLAVLGWGHWLGRWLAAMFVEGILFAWLLVILSAAMGDHVPQWEVLAGLCFLPLVSLAAKLPMLPLRVFWGLHLRWRHDADESDAPTGQFGIAHLIGATTLVALGLGLAQLPVRGSSGFWVNFGILCVAFLLMSALIGIPSLFAAFSRNLRPIVGAICIAVYSQVLAAATLAVLGVVQVTLESDGILCLLLLSLAACETTFFSMWLVRAFEFDLCRGGRRPLAEAPAVETATGDSLATIEQ